MNPDRQLRIGIDITAAVCQGGGIGRYSRELVRSLINHKSQLKYSLISAKPVTDSAENDSMWSAENVDYRSLPMSDRWLYRLWHKLRFPLRADWLTGRIDLFHSPDFVLPPVSKSLPTVLTVHDLSFIHFPEAFTPALLRFLNKAVPRSIERATHILADSIATKNDLQEAWNVPAAKISVIYSGVSPVFKPIPDKKLKEENRRKYKIGEQPYIFSVGTLQPRKNYEMLIRAFKPISEKLPHQLVIAGAKGWLYAQIQKEIYSLGLEDRVRLLGFAEDKDLPALYSNASLFAFPSLYEGFGLPIVEAMACGVPVLSSNASSLPEVTGEAAVLLSPENQDEWSEQMEYLLLSPEKRSKMVGAGFLQARKFKWQKSAGEVVTIYESLIT